MFKTKTARAGNILIIEDDKNQLEAMRKVLQSDFPQSRVETAIDRETAISILKKKRVDVVVSDMKLGMKLEGGHEMLLEIKNENPGIEVIVVTAGPAEWQHAVRCMRAGCLYYGLKLSPDDLRALVVQALELSRASGRRRSLTELLILANWEMIAPTLNPDKEDGSLGSVNPGAARPARGSNLDHNKKGEYLESLVSHIFSTIDGWTVQKRKTSSTEEIDLVVLNESVDGFWSQRGSFILVECKNWGEQKRKPGRSEYDAFLCKLLRRTSDYCRLGFFVSLNGVSQKFAQAARHPSGTGGPVVITLDRKALWSLICSRDRSDWLKRRVHDHVFG
jgi:DNA-binding NarL/FixJ family response regulator